MGRGARRTLGTIIALICTLTRAVHARQLAPTDYLSNEDVPAAGLVIQRDGINELRPADTDASEDGYYVKLSSLGAAGDGAARGEQLDEETGQQQQQQQVDIPVPQQYIHHVDVGVPAGQLSPRELLWIRDRMAQRLNLPLHNVLLQPQWSSGQCVGMVLVRPDAALTELTDYRHLIARLPDNVHSRHILRASSSFDSSSGDVHSSLKPPPPHLLRRRRRSSHADIQDDTVWFAAAAAIGEAESSSESSSSESSLWGGGRDAAWPWLPYVMAAAAALVMLGGAALVIWCCLRRRRQHSEKSSSGGAAVIGEVAGGAGADEVKLPLPLSPIVASQICLYPSAKPDVHNPTLIQPSLASLSTGTTPSRGTPVHCGSLSPPLTGYSSPATYSSSSSTPFSTPVHTPPPRNRRHHRGLLERRGSNASLTIDLSFDKPTNEPKWGSPPKESSAEEYLMSASHRMTRKELFNCLKNVTALYEEFWELPMNHPDKVEVAGSGMKNRYRTIIPNEASRVKLPELDGDVLTSYINANYIRGYGGEPRAYIAMQGPMSNTVVDFWRMIWQEKAPIVVMITKLKEKNRTKCESYLPEHYAAYSVDLEVFVHSISEKDGFILRHITVKCGTEEHSLVHYWYTAWPDHKAPYTARQLLDLVHTVHAHKRSVPGPIVVHCSAGIGRTGCFIGTSIGVHQLQQESIVDVLSIICTMRLDRGGMVQTNEQYEFVHQALSLYEREHQQPEPEPEPEPASSPAAATTD